MPSGLWKEAERDCFIEIMDKKGVEPKIVTYKKNKGTTKTTTIAGLCLYGMCTLGWYTLLLRN